MTNLLKVAMEALDTGVEEEKEYGFFVLMSSEQLTNFMQMAEGGSSSHKGLSCEGIVEVALPSKVPYNGVKSRLRLYTKANGEESCELTTKKVIDAITKDEYNDPISIVNFQALAGSGKSVIVRKRFTIPFVDENGDAILRKSGKVMQWEIDVYLDGSSKETFDGRMPNHWIKLDLEVDNAIDNVIETLPFTGEQVIEANSTNASDRAIIDGLYAKGYPVTPYIGLEFWDSADLLLDLTKF